MQFEVDTGQVSQTVSKLESEVSTIREQYTGLYQELQTLDAMWTGSAHDAFVAAYSRDMEMMESLAQTIGEIVENIGTARQKYDSTEQSVRSSINKISI
ncbi:MAG: WXG100 family type VII secretion target [Clostridiales bacterium]|nr:WXG100 family type VII secretion target [Clostridiales bacterium]